MSEKNLHSDYAMFNLAILTVQYSNNLFRYIKLTTAIKQNMLKSLH